ncbi:hypothetical protein [Allobranchiibius huperziae]|uniref:NAD/NADP transhydrogenase beta subunit n=1 Tax=Allobranchiibius huperziae TaxID=1874116 RepID=A0A853DBQ1_9MICO|nr:hypothetical protein [Allobranchiibius huperziae]NYJ74358.1 NAD/NADP transhydrogenase beta subunit [Allobranchiibius huperziae]
MSDDGGQGRDTSGYGAMPQEHIGLGKPVTSVPKPLDMAVKLMYLGAALTLIGLIYSAFNTGRVHDALVKSNDKKTGNAHLSASAIDTAAHVIVIVSVVIGVLTMLIWIAMAVLNRQGRNWARIVATVLFGLSAVSFLYTVIAVASQGGGSLSVVVSVLNFLIGLAAVVLMWRPESSAYYHRNDNRQQQYA